MRLVSAMSPINKWRLLKQNTKLTVYSFSVFSSQILSALVYVTSCLGSCVYIAMHICSPAPPPVHMCGNASRKLLAGGMFHLQGAEVLLCGFND